MSTVRKAVEIAEEQAINTLLEASDYDLWGAEVR